MPEFLIVFKRFGKNYKKFIYGGILCLKKIMISKEQKIFLMII